MNQIFRLLDKDQLTLAMPISDPAAQTVLRPKKEEFLTSEMIHAYDKSSRGKSMRLIPNVLSS